MLLAEFFIPFFHFTGNDKSNRHTVHLDLHTVHLDLHAVRFNLHAVRFNLHGM